MANWNIEVKKLDFDAFTWNATSDGGDFQQSNRWTHGVFDTEAAALSDAVLAIQFYEVKKTRKAEHKTAHFEFVTNG